MIAIDTNLLVYAHMRQSPWNQRSYALLGDLVASGATWALPVHCVSEFFAIVTHPRIYKPASKPSAALAQIDAWIASPTVCLLGEDAETWSIQRDLVRATRLIGAGIHDARIAAVCIQHDVAELWTTDRDFSQFIGLRTRNPLTDPPPSRAGEARNRYRVERRGRPRGDARAL